MSKIGVLIAACLLSATTFGQIRYEKIVRSNFWNEGTNVAGIREGEQGVSNAEIGGGYKAGAFRDSYMAEDQWNIGFKARTITHNHKFSMIGSFAFDNTEANNACGSMFVNPGYYPVDVLEFTPGHKTFQTYSIMGGISVDLDKNWKIGGLFDYKSNNAAKRKDLRYSSYNMDLKFSPAIIYKGDGYIFGLSAIVTRKTETITAEQIGTTTTAPFAFFDEGLMFGNYQAWTGSGVHLKESGVSGTPLIRNSYGIGLQHSSIIYLDLSFSVFNGSAGERQINWYRFNGFESSGLLAFRFDENNQSVRLRYDWERLSMNETIYDKKVTGGITLIEEYGSNPLTNRNILNFRAEYEYLSQDFELRAALVAKDRQTITTPQYPLVFTQEILTFGGEIEAWKKFGTIALKLNLGYHQGTIKEQNIKLEDTNVSDPFRLEDYYNIANEYLTAPRIDANLAIRYNFRNRLYTEINGGITNAFGLKYIAGSTRYGANLILGYNF